MKQNSAAIISNDYELSGGVHQLISVYAFFMAFPVIVIFQNISVFIFIILLFVLSSERLFFVRFSTLIQKAAVFFGIGAITSTVGSYFIGGRDALQSAMIVLPNYLYWAFLIVFLITYSDFLKIDRIFKALTLGLISSITYFFFLQRLQFINDVGIFKGLSQNAFAFLLICYTPIAVSYIKSRSRPIIAIAAILVFGIIGFTSGSRSGSVLVLTGALLVYFISESFSKRKVLAITAFGILSILFFTSPLAERIVYSLNSRTYNLLYSTNKTLINDKSFLVRRAMIEKGVGLFKSHPITGIGLNNFSGTKGDIQGAFEGSEKVLHKKLDIGKSAHNSYISLLSEGGLVVTIPFLMILFIILKHFFINFRLIPTSDMAVFIGIIMMSIHLYFISAILNVFAWFLIGLASALVYRHVKKAISRDT